MSNKPIDYEKALLDPTSVFESPEVVKDCANLDREQKIEILRRWEYDACELAVAEEEGMIGGGPSLLSRILTELNILTGGHFTKYSPPTKQGGLSRSDMNEN